MAGKRKAKGPVGVELELMNWANNRNSSANEQTPNRRCQFCGLGVVCEHGRCDVCQRCKPCERVECQR